MCAESTNNFIDQNTDSESVGPLLSWQPSSVTDEIVLCLRCLIQWYQLQRTIGNLEMRPV